MKIKLNNIINTSIISDIVDFIYPRRCPICFNEITSNEVICKSCLKSIQEEIKPTLDKIDKTYNHLYLGRYHTSPLLSHLIHLLKYERIKEIGIFLGDLISKYFYSYIQKNNLKKFEYIIPVPTSKKRLIYRGFNHIEIIAEKVSSELNIRYIKNGIIKIKETKTQASLNYNQRLINLKNAFKSNIDFFFKDKKIILIDDVLTTGTTIKEIIKVLKVEKIFILTILKT